MKKLQSMEESSFLRLFFAAISVCLFLCALIAPDRAQMLSGQVAFLTGTCKVPTNLFALGGYSATLLNMGIVGVLCCLLFCLPGAKANNVSTLAFLLTVGFGAWGINAITFWPGILGVGLYCLVKKEKLGSNVNAMLFSTGISPLISDLLLRYPHGEILGFNLAGALLAVVVGCVIGFTLPAGLSHSPIVHKGFDLYSAALPVGMTAFLLNGVLYKATGVALPSAPDSSTLLIASPGLVYGFFGTVFLLAAVLALVLGAKPAAYWKLLSAKDHVPNIIAAFGKEVWLLNFGVYGLMILGYYALTGATANAVLLGLIFCTVCTCNSGSHPGSVWPIMAGYAAAAFLFGQVSTLVGGSFSLAINAQAIAIGLCFANGLSPICAKYGPVYGFLAAILHYCLVTLVPSLHGGFCLYNGGFTAALTCLIVVPQLERFCKTRAQRLEQKAMK